MNSQKTIFAIITSLSVSLALAEDFKTVKGKEYKDATITRVEPDGIVLKTKSGITKLYFTELPKEVQERFHYGSATLLRRQLERRSLNASVAKALSIGLRNKSKKSSTSENRYYRGNTHPARQSRW